MSEPAFRNPYGPLSALHGLSKVTGADSDKLGDMLRDAIPATQEAADAAVAVERDWADLRQSFSDLTCRLTDVQSNLQTAQWRTWGEITTNPAADTRALAEPLLPLEREAGLLADVRDLLQYVSIPAALIQKLEAAVKLRQAESLEASLHYAFDEAQTLAKLEAANIQPGLFIGERVEALRRASVEADRMARQAQIDLDSERERQAITLQARMANNQLTRAEIVHGALQLSQITSEGNQN